MNVRLTDANTDMRASEVAVSLRDGAHTNLIISTREEGGKGAHERNSALASGGTNCHTNEVLFGNEALNKLIRSGIAQIDREGGVFCITI